MPSPLRALLLAGITGAACASLDDGDLARPKPLTPRHALRILDRELHSELVEDLRSGRTTALDLHFGLGAYLRSAWGLWSGSALKRWFERRDIFHPEDMSSIVLASFERKVRGRPIDLRGQVRRSRDAWHRQEAIRAEEVARSVGRAATIDRARSGWIYDDREVPTVAIQPGARTPRVAKLERLRGGFLVFLSADSSDASDARWHDGVFRIHGPSGPLLPAKRAGCPEIHDVVTVGDRTTWLCRADARWLLLSDSDGATTPIDLPSPSLRLGTDGDTLFVHDRDAIYSHESGAWRRLAVCKPEGACTGVLPMSGDTPRRHDSTIYFTPHGLVVDTDTTQAEHFQERWGISHFGHISMDLLAAAPTGDGGLWLSARAYLDDDDGILLRLSAEGEKIPILFGSVDRPATFDDGYIATPHLTDTETAHSIPANAIFADEALYLAGPQGIAVVKDGRVAPVLRFTTLMNSSWGWHPDHIGRFFDGSFLLADRNGGIRLLRKRPDGYTAHVVWPHDPQSTPASDMPHSSSLYIHRTLDPSR